MPHQTAAAYTLVATRPNGAALRQQADTPEQVVAAAERLAPFVPHDATWEVEPCPPSTAS